jgi:putative MATE family efflux protein
MLSNVLQSAGQTANAIYLGRLVGVKSLAAVSAIFPIIFFLISFLIGLASGSTVLIGQAFGARDHVRLKQIAGTTLALTLVLGFVVGTIGGLFSYRMLAALGTPADIIGIAAGYARIIFFWIPILFLYLMYTTFLRGTGDTKTPFFALIAGTILTLVITPAFILGWLGLPAFSTNGAAIASVVSNALALGGLLAYLGLTKNPLAFDREMLANLRLRWHLVRTIARIGIPTSINLVMVSLSEIAVLSFVNHYGSTAVAAYGAVNQIVSYAQFPAISIGIAASIFGAQSIGAGRAERLAPIVRSAVVLNYAIEGALIAIIYLFGVDVIRNDRARPALDNAVELRDLRERARDLGDHGLERYRRLADAALDRLDLGRRGTRGLRALEAHRSRRRLVRISRGFHRRPLFPADLLLRVLEAQAAQTVSMRL